MCRCTYNVIDTYKSIKNNEEVNENELSSKLALKLTQCNFLFKKKNIYVSVYVLRQCSLIFIIRI